MATRVRSPNYPIISLPDAVDRARRIYDKEHLHKADPEVICKAMGYTGVNGSSLGVLSALKKYLLLDEVGKDLKISSDALTILVDPSASQGRTAAIRKAARAPALFQTLFDEFGDSPPSDENLRAFLLKRGFAQAAVDTPIRTYRETLEFVSRETGAYHSPQSLQEDSTIQVTEDRPSERSPSRQQNATHDQVAGASSPAGIRRDVWDLDEGRVTLERPAELGEDSLEYLEAWLELLLKKIKREKLGSKSRASDWIDPPTA